MLVIVAGKGPTGRPLELRHGVRSQPETMDEVGRNTRTCVCVCVCVCVCEAVRRGVGHNQPGTMDEVGRSALAKWAGA